MLSKNKIMKGNCILIGIWTAILCLSANVAWGQIQDITPPVLLSYDYSPTSIDVTSGTKTVSVTTHITDDLSGVNYAYFYFRSPSGQTYSGAYLALAGGTNTDGTFNGVAYFYNTYEPGTWNVAYMYVYDSVGNYRYYYGPNYCPGCTPQLPSGSPTTLSVTNNNVVDRTPASLSDLSFTPTSVDVSLSSANVTVAAHATDDNSGVNYAYGYFYGPPNSLNQRPNASVYIPVQSVNGGVATMQGTMTIPRYAAAGTWNLWYLYLYDKAGNYRIYYGPAYCPGCSPQFPAGTQTALTVTSSPSDSNPPTLIGFDFNPKAIDVATSSKNISITANVTDDFDSLFGGNSVNYVSLSFVSPPLPGGGTQQRGTGLSRTPNTHTWTGSINFPQYSAAGNWRISYIYVTDALNNYRYYYQDDLNSLGFPSNIQISSGLSVADATGTYGGTATLNATLTNAGSPVSGKLITFYLNGSSTSIGSATTDGSGVATLSDASLAGLNANIYYNGIKATFAGDQTLNAVTGFANLTVSKATATLTINQSTLNQNYTGSARVVTATSNPSGLSGISVTYNGSTTAPVNAGSYAVVVSLNNQNYAAQNATGTLVVNPISATLTINQSSLSQTYDGSPKAVTVTTTPSGLTGVSVTYDDSPSPPVNAGDYSVKATLTNQNYTASEVTDTLAISKANQSIIFGQLADKMFGDPPFTVSATGGGSGNPVTFIAAPASICNASGTNGSTITIVGSGICKVTASQAGNNNYNAAADVERSFTIAAPPELSINDIEVTEGDNGTINATFTVSLSAASNAAVAVDFSSADGTAKNPSDYTASSGSVTIAAGQTSATITIAVKGEALYEANEAFVVNLSNPINATISDGQGEATITNDDSAPTLSISDVSVTEGNSGTVNASFTVSQTAVSSLDTTVDFSTADGTAKNPSDYTASSGSVTIAAGQTSATITIAVKGEALYEANEAFVVNLSNPNNATIADGEGEATITNDDAAPTLSISDVSVTEGNSGSVNASFTVSQSAISGLDTAVDFSTADGTANNPSDYAAASGQITIAAGSISATIHISVKGDALYEDDETFLVSLSNPANATVATSSATATIVNDDAPPSLAINDISVSEGNSGTTDAQFTVSLSAASGLPTSVNYSTTAGTATADSDYTTTSGTLTIPAGATTGSVVVPVIGDSLKELDETFSVNLTNPIKASIADSLGNGTITNDDFYQFNGFLQPVDNPGPGPNYVYNSVKAGSAVPVKFSLTGDQGLNIFVPGYPVSQSCACTSSAPDLIEETITAGNSSLTYDAVSDQYTYVWKTDKTWTNGCRKLTVKLIDGTDHVAYFKFTK